MSHILKDAGHGKFKQEDILSLERDVLQALNFKVQTTSIYDEAMETLKKMIFTFKKHSLALPDLDLLYNFVTFLSQLALHEIELVLLNKQLLITALIYVGLKFCKKTFLLYSK